MNKEIEVRELLEENFPDAIQGKSLFVARLISNIYSKKKITVIEYDKKGKQI